MAENPRAHLLRMICTTDRCKQLRPTGYCPLALPQLFIRLTSGKANPYGGNHQPLSLLCSTWAFPLYFKSGHQVNKHLDVWAWWPGWLSLESTGVAHRASSVWECGFTLNLDANTGDHRSWPVTQLWEQPVSPSSVAEKTCPCLTVRYSRGEICGSSDSSPT